MTCYDPSTIPSLSVASVKSVVEPAVLKPRLWVPVTRPRTSYQGCRAGCHGQYDLGLAPQRTSMSIVSDTLCIVLSPSEP